MTDVHLPPGDGEPLPRPASELMKRVVSAVVLGLAALATAWVGGLPFLIVWTAAALAVWWEWTGITKAEPRALVVGVGAAAILCMAAALAFDAAAIAFVCAVIGAGVAMASVQTSRAWAGAGVIYAAATLVPAVMLRGDPALGLVAILWLFAVVWAQDTGAYFAGRLIGGPKLAPSISPSKTWSGAAGGTIAGVAAGAMVVLLAAVELRAMHIAIAFVIVVAAMLGDLLESWIKRRFGAKDSGTLIPGHGGVMDRLDGFIIAAAVALAIGLARGGTDNPAAGLLLW